MAHSVGIFERIANWFHHSSADEDRASAPKRRKQSPITAALESVAMAEERLTTVEEATMAMSVDDLPKEFRDGYEEDSEEDYDDWFEED